ncbi:MAG TPA: class I SAM-dependent methyltransferase [Kofleriaceae bacterium]|jgi:SAM-dependent methyltransferase
MDRNPQAKQMADESMVRTLAAQIEAIWPQEEPIVRASGWPANVLDVGCGTGEFTSRIARLFPAARVTGVDLVEASLELARARCADLGDRVRFARGDAYELAFADATFDFVGCRHVLQAIPDAPRVLGELVRVLAPGGRLHVIAEDYGMIHAVSPTVDLAKFWFEQPRAFARATGTDLHIGRHIAGHLSALSVRVEDVAIHYIAVDTLRVPRATFAAIFEAWRDGYVPALHEHVGTPEPELRAAFDATIDAIRDPNGYALWLVPLVTARRAS